MDKKNSNNIILSSSISKLGNIIFDYINQMMITILFPKNPIFLALYHASEQIISIIFNLFGGVFSDYYNRKNILIITDIFSCIMCLLNLFFINSKYAYISILIINICLAILSSFRLPSYNAIVKDAITEMYIEKHFSLFSIFKEFIAIIGPLLGFYIWKYTSIELASIFNSVSFAISAFISMKLKVNNCKYKKQKIKFKVFLINMKKGFIYISNNEIKYLICLSAIINLFLCPIYIYLPYLNGYYKGNVDNFYSKALIFQSIGVFIFSLINKRYMNKNNDKKLICSLILVGNSLFFIYVLDYFKYIYAIFFFFMCLGGGLAVFNIQFYTLIQQKVKIEFIGRVYSIVLTASLIFMPLGLIFFGSIVNINNLIYFGVSGGGISAIVLVYSLFLFNSRR